MFNDGALADVDGGLVGEVYLAYAFVFCVGLVVGLVGWFAVYIVVVLCAILQHDVDGLLDRVEYFPRLVIAFF